MFSKRFTLFTIQDIRIAIDASWFLIAILLSWTLATAYFPEVYPGLIARTYWIMGILGMLGLFACVLLHELGHAMVAKHYKIPIAQITLFIFGGIAEIRQEPKKPSQEFFIAIAGPIVSAILALGMFGITALGLQRHWPGHVIAVTHYLAFINTVIIVFNMIPAFPLDGGRVLRSLLWWWKKDYTWATKVASFFGSAFGFFLIAMGLYFFINGNVFVGFWWGFIGWFLIRASGASGSEAVLKKELRGEKVGRFMTKDPIAVSPGISVQELIDRYVYASHHHLYPVAESGKLLGYVSLKEVNGVNQEKWPATSVKEIMVPVSSFETITPETTALQALEIMRNGPDPTLLVVEKGGLVGILTAQDLFKVISVKLALHK